MVHLLSLCNLCNLLLQLSLLDDTVTGPSIPIKAPQQNQHPHLLKELQLVGRAACSCCGLVSMAMDASSSLPLGSRERQGHPREDSGN